MALEIIPFEVFIPILRSKHYVLLFDVSKHLRSQVCKYLLDYDNRQYMMKAAKLGSLSFMKWFYSKSYRLPQSLFETAVTYNQITVCEWLHFNKCPYEPYISQIAAKKGYLTSCQWLREKGYALSSNIPKAAANGGHLDIIQWSDDIGIVPCDHTYYHASKRGDIPMLEYLCEYNTNPDTNHICSGAVIGNQLETLKWLIDHGFRWHIDCFEVASEKGYLDILQYLYELDPSCDSNNLLIAASNGHLDVVQWFQKQGYHLNILVCESAAESGNFELLSWLHEQGCEFTSRQFYINAVKSCSLKTIKWLYSLDSDPEIWNQDLIADSYNNLEILKWFHTIINMDTWARYIFEIFIITGKLLTLKWFHDHATLSTCKWRDDLGFIAVQYAQHDILLWLHNNGYLWTPKLCTEAAKLRLSTLTFLLLHSCPTDNETKETILNKYNMDNLLFYVVNYQSIQSGATKFEFMTLYR